MASIKVHTTITIILRYSIQKKNNLRQLFSLKQLLYIHVCPIIKMTCSSNDF